MAAEVFAPAKINLTLHVTGQRVDGYHLLDSLVVFADVGDRIIAKDADRLSLTITGPMAGGLDAGEGNLVLRAARFLGPGGAAITLCKTLPVASGIGGGSTDAAATLRALAQLWQRPLPDVAETAALGADVPVCLMARSCRMLGVGEILADVPPLPPVWLVLANPGVAVRTPQVFGALSEKSAPPMPKILPACADAAELARFLGGQRNDLEAPARRFEPAIGAVLAAVARTPNCLLARMSGSGATCFGLFGSAAGASRAAKALTAAEPAWWVRAAKVL